MFVKIKDHIRNDEFYLDLTIDQFRMLEWLMKEDFLDDCISYEEMKNQLIWQKI